MPTTNSQSVLIPARAYVYLATPGTTAPTTTAGDPPAAWKHVGLTTPDSLTFTTEPEFEQVNSHQSDFPVKRFQTGDSATISVDMLEWNETNLKQAFGGGTVTSTGTAPNKIFTYTAPVLGARTEVACLIDVVEGTKKYRFIFPRCLQIEGAEVSLNKSQEARLPLRLAVLGGDAVAPFTVLTDDQNFEAAA